ncbi:MAG: hypothetical protein ACI4NP_01860 [Thermoguttaceae bacterium]
MNTNDPLSHWKTPNISARPRTENETRDLAVRVFARNLKPISLHYAIMAVPALLLCYLFWIGSFYLLFSEETSLGGDFYDCFTVACIWWVLVTASLYYLSEFCGALVTKYLGMWLFSGEERVTLKTTLHSTRGRWGQSIYFLLLTRPIRLRSFYAEILLLENTPFLRTENGVSTKRRVKRVNSSGSFFALGLGSLVTESFVNMGVSVGCGVFFLLALAVFQNVILAFFLTAVLWLPILTAASRLFMTVYHFCSYVNYRVKNESWDVELLFKSELAKLGKDSIAMVGDQTPSGAFVGNKRLGPLVLDPNLMERENGVDAPLQNDEHKEAEE